MGKWDGINFEVMENLCHPALSYMDFPRHPALSYTDYHAAHVRFTGMSTPIGNNIDRAMDNTTLFTLFMAVVTAYLD